MSILEYDLLADAYAAGYASAVNAVYGTRLRIINRRYKGHLYSTSITGDPACSIAELSADDAQSWETYTRPAIYEHFEEFAWLRRSGHRTVRRLGKLFEENVYLHHLMLLPIRAQVCQYVEEYGAELATSPTSARTIALAVLNLVTPRDLPFANYISRLAAHRGEGPSPADSPQLGSVAPDGDGYGLTIPGWLDDQRYVDRFRRLLARLGVTAKDVRKRAADSARKTSDSRLALQAHTRSPRWPHAVDALLEAQHRSRITESHGPLMHVEYMSRFRRLLLAWGEQLTAGRRLDVPEQVFHLSCYELERDRWDRYTVRKRCSRYDQQLAASLPAEEVSWPNPPGEPCVMPTRTPLAALTATCPGEADDLIDVTPAAPGRAEGRLRYLHRQTDIDKLTCGDIAVVPDGGSAWGWLAFAGVPLVVVAGSPLGHAATLARVAGAPCVIASAELARILPEGATVRLSSDAGRIECDGSIPATADVVARQGARRDRA